jgi:hypothetical protein
MSALGNRIAKLAGLIGTIQGLELVNEEVRHLNERLASPGYKLSHDEVIDLRAALGILGKALAEMSRVARGMLEGVGVRGIDHVG